MDTSNDWDATSFVGMQRELDVLLSEAQSSRSTRWLVVGERGIGKTRLTQEVARRLDAEAFTINLARAALGQPYDLAKDLNTLSQDTALVVLDEVDYAPLIDPPSVLNALSRLARTTLLMTATDGDLDPSWSPIAGPMTDTIRMSLKGLTNVEGCTLLAAAGALNGPHETVAGTTKYDGALGVAMGNPRLLFEWAYWHRDKTPKSELATILDADGRPVPPDDKRIGRIEVATMGISDALVAELVKKPQLMYGLSPRQFEELVAELYERNGFEVELTRASKDGGVDIYAFQKAPFGSFLTIVDCKHNRADRPVQVGLIRQLYGTVMATDASVGVIATTSYFTKGAKTFQAERKHRLGLQDFVDLKDMLQRSQADLSQLGN